MEVPEVLRQYVRRLVEKRTGAVAATVCGVDRVTLYRAMNGKASRRTIGRLEDCFRGTATTATTTRPQSVHAESPSR